MRRSEQAGAPVRRWTSGPESRSLQPSVCLRRRRTGRCDRSARSRRFWRLNMDVTFRSALTLPALLVLAGCAYGPFADGGSPPRTTASPPTTAAAPVANTPPAAPAAAPSPVAAAPAAPAPPSPPPLPPIMGFRDAVLFAANNMLKAATIATPDSG